MSEPVLGLLSFLVLFVLIGLRMPVGLAMFVCGTAGYVLIVGWPPFLAYIKTTPYFLFSNYTLSVIPLFILMGAFAERIGLSQALFTAANVFVGHRRGGMAMAAIGACAGFGAICGSSLATAATMARVALPEMRRYGSRDSLAAGAGAAGGTLGVLIPPSVILVIYALVTGQSIGALFAAALLPGLLGTLLYMAAVSLYLRLDPTAGPAGRRFTAAERLRALAETWPVLLLFALVIGGIYLGWFSPTEAAAVGAAGALLLALLRGGLTRAEAWAAVLETAGTTAMIFLILVGAALFNDFLEVAGLPAALTGLVAGSGLPPYAVLVLLMLCYIILGCFMDSLSMMLLTLPVVFPLIQSLGFDPVWFGILLVTVVEIGLITPPVGLNLFVIQSVDPELRLPTVVRGVLPFIAADVVRLTLLILVPGLALWLPSLME